MNEELREIIDKGIKQFNLTEEEKALLVLYMKLYYQEGYKAALVLIEKFIPKEDI